MILTDKDIKQFGADLIVEGYDESCVTSISYDLHISDIIVEDGKKDSYILRPNEFIFIKTKEKISMPDNMMGIIGEKNSRIRQGLSVHGPHYFPGHKTFLFIRVKNETSSEIKINKGDSIAQIFFEELNGIPENTYRNQPDASFNDEDEYRGMGKYKDEYEQRITKVDDMNEKLDKRIDNLYANVLTIMGLFVSMFSIIVVNFTNLKGTKAVDVITMNISLGIIITLFIGLLIIFINEANNKRFLSGFIVLMIVLILLLFFVL